MKPDHGGLMEQTSVPVWVGSWGEYVVPPELRDVKIRKDGWVDLRHKRAADLLSWAAKQERMEEHRLICKIANFVSMAHA